MKKNKKTMIFCGLLISILLIISGIVIADKMVFSKEKSVSNEINSMPQGNVIGPGSSNISEYSQGLEPLEKKSEEANTEFNTLSIDSEQTTPRIEFVYSETKVPNYNSEEYRITTKEEDDRIIPDKYNTGCHGKLNEIPEDYTVNGIKLKSNNGKLIFDFFYSNKDAVGSYIIEDYDFSDYEVVFYHAEKVKGKKINIVFNNCRFTSITGNRIPFPDTFTFTYNNCTIKRFYGSDSTFNRCRFGDSYRDCVTPFANITVNDSYFANLASNDPKGNGVHSDGTQMYGHADAMVKNVLFSNCRFEIPYVKTTQSTAYVNACIMLSLEFNNGDNIIFKDCILNGGGYTIYAGTKSDALTLSNVLFSNIRIGNAKMYGNIYPKYNENVVFTDVENQDSLYVSSVWNDGSKTHVIVTNDTEIERTLRVVTGSGYKDYIIDRCIGGDELRNDNYDMSFDEFPFDIEITIDDKADYVICYDITDGDIKQIRYVSFDGKSTYYNPYPESEIVSEEGQHTELPEIIIEGSCGKEITYCLDGSGTLSIEGKGTMYNYSSKKTAPWHEYADSITCVNISEGISQIGAQAFLGLKNIKYINLPRSIVVIGSNAFLGCSNLKQLSMHSGVNSIGDFAFHAVKLEECTFYGTEEIWNTIIIGKNNGNLLSCLKTYKSENS